jgi:hypothetical protein
VSSLNLAGVCMPGMRMAVDKPFRIQLSFAYFWQILRVEDNELGGETDQPSDGGCALNVDGMRRPHQVVGSQKELLRDR